MKQKHYFFVTVGIPSLFLIFSVLVLSVLALLTLGSSRNSLNTAKLTLVQTEKYFKACSSATETVSQIRSWAGKFAEESASEEEYFSQLSQFADTEGALTWDSAKHTLSFSKNISDTQQLSVILELLYPAEKNTQALNVLQWNTELTDSWTPDNSQNIFKGGK